MTERSPLPPQLSHLAALRVPVNADPDVKELLDAAEDVAVAETIRRLPHIIAVGSPMHRLIEAIAKVRKRME